MLLRWALAAASLLAAACGHAGAPASRAEPPPPPAAAKSREPSARGSYGPEPAATPTPLERAALDAAQARLAGGGEPPRVSPALVLAARELAQRAADGNQDPLARPHLRSALAGALAFDPAPAAHLAIARPADASRALVGTLAGAGTTTHLGAGAAVREGQAYVVLLLSRRAARLQSFPREVAPGTTATLRGELLDLERPSVHVTSPSGVSQQVALLRAPAARAFSAPVHFDTAGRWLVEVLGTGQRGPEVAALLTVSCGGASLGETASPADGPDPDDPREAEARVVATLNATRRAHDLPLLEPAPALAAVARRHSEAMLARGILAHVLPDSGSVGDRLRRERISYARVAENVARGGSAMAAHRGAEESPAHRENILSRGATQIGCGIARGRLATGEPIVYLTEIFLEPVEDGSDDRMTPATRVREAIWRERARLQAPPMTSDPMLDDLARTAAREMLRDGEPGGERLGESALRLGRKLAAVDAFVATKPSDAARSRNLADRRFRRVGVGIAIGDSPHYGVGLLWIAVVYTD